MKKTSIWKIIKKYHWESQFLKSCFIWFGIVLIPTFIIGAILTGTITVIYSQKLKQSNDFHNANTVSKLESIFTAIDDYHYSFSNNYMVSQYLLDKTTDNNDLSITVQNVVSLINTFTFSNSYIDSIYLYNPKNNFIVSNQSSGSFDSFYDTAWYDNKKMLIFPRTVYYDGREHKYITICRDVILHGSALATTVYNIDADELKKALVSDSNPPLIQITDEKNNLFFSTSDTENFEKTAKNTYITELSYQLSLYVDFSDTISEQLKNSVVGMFWLFFAIFLIGDIILSYKLSENYFLLIVENILQFQTPYTDENISENKLRELDLIVKNPLSPTFSKKAEKFLINQYAKLKSMQLTSLQEQINPHFMFNTLGLISLLDLEENDEPTKITDITENLADILRYSIETGTNTVSFEEELSYLDKYIDIQNIKYDGKFEYIKTFDKEINNCIIMKFILQPIAENAIIHGILRSKERRGTIRLNAYKKDSKLYIDISNTGETIPEETLSELNIKLSHFTEIPGKHIGLINVNNRIKLLFGEEFGCRITSENNNTTVSITLPFEIYNQTN